MSTALTFSGLTAPQPESLGYALLALSSELLFGYLLGTLPSMVLDGLAVAGQLTAASIGLAQANTIDPSIGQNVTVLSHFKTLTATLIFLSIDGHHAIIKAATMGIGGGASSAFSLAQFVPTVNTTQMFIEHFSQAFDLALIVSAPIIATVLLTQFTLGLVTKFIPQVNIFIISLPLSVLVGIYIIAFSIPELSEQIVEHFEHMTISVNDLWSTSAHIP
jgi:flagellar biosynthetic protein FliR